MNEGTRSERLQSVAQAYLGQSIRTPRFIILGADERAETRMVEAGLRSASVSLGLSTAFLRRRDEAIDVEMGEDESTGVVFFDHGVVDRDQIARLQPPDEHGTDTLVWCLPDDEQLGLRSIHSAAVFSWSLKPRQMRCVLAPSRSSAVPSHTRERVLDGLRVAGLAGRVEVLQQPSASQGPDTQRFYEGLLQACLSSASSVTHRVARVRDDVVAKRALGALVLFLASACMSVFPASADELELRIMGLPRSVDELSAADGSTFMEFPEGFVRLGGEIGRWEAGGALVLNTLIEDVAVRLDGEVIASPIESRQIEDQLIVHAADFSLVLRTGNVDWANGRLIVDVGLVQSVAPVEDGITSLPTGLIVFAVLLVVILLMLRRAGRKRRELDTPYEPRRRGFGT